MERNTCVKLKPYLYVTSVLHRTPEYRTQVRFWVLVLTCCLVLAPSVLAQDSPPHSETSDDIKPLHIGWSPKDIPSTPEPVASSYDAHSNPPTRLVFPVASFPQKSLEPSPETRGYLKPPASNPKGPSEGATDETPATDPDEAPAKGDGQAPEDRFQWGEALRQAALFNSLQHVLRFATEDGTRKEIKGPFFRDWFQSVRNLRGWRDGDPFLVNYIGHPIMGAASGYIQIQNDPRGRYLEFEPTRKGYWKSRLKAMAWSAAYSTQFELGPISEASLGNVGRAPRPDGKSPMSYVDLIITPTVGTLWLMGEDALDKHLIQRFEKRVRNQFWRGIVRSFLNPGRSIANAMRFKGPWHRDRRPL